MRLWPETGSGNMAGMSVNLRLEAADGSGVEEYRVHGGDIEVRRKSCESGQANGRAASGREEWRRLSASEIASHVDRNTAVAQWLRHRIGWRELLLVCTDKGTLEMFGVAKDPVDRHVA